MKRYQLVPWASGPSINVELARYLARDIEGISKPAISYRICKFEGDAAVWKGTNLPAVLVFSASTPEAAQALRTAYGEQVCFVEERRTANRI